MAGICNIIRAHLVGMFNTGAVDIRSCASQRHVHLTHTQAEADATIAALQKELDMVKRAADVQRAEHNKTVTELAQVPRISRHPHIHSSTCACMYLKAMHSCVRREDPQG